MDLRPVDAVAAVRPVNVKRTTEDVAPPFALNRPGRMEEDSYDANTGQPNRGLEEDGPDEPEHEEELHEDPAEHDFDDDQPVKHLNLFV
jgi:hypothetical protein